MKKAKKTTQIPTLNDLAVAENVLDFVDPAELWNYFTQTPVHEREKNPYREFVKLCRQNLGWAARKIIGTGDFELLPFQVVILEKLWNRQFPLILMTRGGGKTFILSVYTLLRAILDQTPTFGHKIVITAAAFRQSKNVMENIERLYRMSPIIKACSTEWEGIRKNNDKWEMKIGNAVITALPLGDGQRIRGMRATIILTDEFASVPEEIFNVVVRGFAAVAADPVAKVRRKDRISKAKDRGYEGIEDNPNDGNQIIRTGTASYHFNHYYRMYQHWHKILGNKLKGYGYEKHIRDVLGEDVDPQTHVNYEQYALIEMPYDALPPGYMDDSVINEARLTMTQDEFDMEYNCKFITDSKGFFKASAIDGATPRPGTTNYFDVELRRPERSNAIYVMGIDPARQRDDFALVILKVLRDTHRLVYAKRWNQKNFGKIALEIRDLVNRFGVTRIGIDKGGGGTAVMDFLQTEEMIPQGELPYWELDEKSNAPGLKILDMINYMGKWLVEANYSLCADIEQKRLLFPYALNEDKYIGNSKEYNEMEEVMKLVKQCKEQLTQIEITATDKTEVEHFDLPPEVKWKDKKDLYSALLIADAQARACKIEEVKAPAMSEFSIGGSVDEFAS